MNKINKTIILLGTAVSFYAPISFADAEQFYVKANLGYQKLNDAKDKDDDKFKSKNGNFFFGLGVGYHLTDKVRMDIAFDHFAAPVHKLSFVDTENGDIIRSKVKGNINAFTINGYIDLFDANNIKVFTGAGIGMAQTNAKAVAKVVYAVDGTEESGEFKSKRSNNFTYALHLGATAEISDNLHTDLTYSWRDFGRIKEKQEDEGNSFAYRGHHLTFGIRYDI